MLAPARLLLLCAFVLPGCGGSVASDNRQGAGLGGGGAGGSGDEAGGSGAVPSGSGGRDGLAPPASADAGAIGASGSDSGTPDPSPSVCPIRETGTALTEADCRACIQIGPRCDVFQPAPGLPLDLTNPTLEEAVRICIDIVRNQPSSSFWCLWYADEDPFDKPWGAGFGCRANPGRVHCGGGL